MVLLMATGVKKMPTPGDRSFWPIFSFTKPGFLRYLFLTHRHKVMFFFLGFLSKSKLVYCSGQVLCGVVYMR